MRGTHSISILSCSSYPLAISCRISPSRLIELLVYTYTTHNDSDRTKKRDRPLSSYFSLCLKLFPLPPPVPLFIPPMGIAHGRGVPLFPPFLARERFPRSSVFSFLRSSRSVTSSYFFAKLYETVPFRSKQKQASQFDGFKCNNR